MKINILLPNVTRLPSGGHKVIYEYCNRLSADGNNVEIYYFPRGGLFEKFHLPEAVRIFFVKIYGDIIGPRKWFSLDRKIKTHVVTQAIQMRSANVTIATGIQTAEPVAHLSSEYGKKLYFIQDYENWHYPDNYVNSTFNLGMKNIVISKWLKTIVDQHSPDPSILISDGINTHVFKPEPANRRHHSIVFQYRQNEQKGCKYAIQTIKLLKKKYSDLSVNVISIEKNVPKLPSYCTYYRYITPEQVSEVNRQSEVFICSTIEEGFGLPGLEAMACGCAVASTDYTGVHEYAVDGVNALLSPVRDPVAMSNNVSKLFDDSTLRKNIVEAGIKTGMDKSFENSYQKFKEVLELI